MVSRHQMAATEREAGGRAEAERAEPLGGFERLLGMLDGFPSFAAIQAEAAETELRDAFVGEVARAARRVEQAADLEVGVGDPSGFAEDHRAMGGGAVVASQ